MIDTSSLKLDKVKTPPEEEIPEGYLGKEDKQEKESSLSDREKILDSRQNRSQRKDYANRVFWLVIGWLVSFVVILVLTGCKLLELSDSVLLSLITGASVNIIGLMGIVIKYLFPVPENNK